MVNNNNLLQTSGYISHNCWSLNDSLLIKLLSKCERRKIIKDVVTVIISLLYCKSCSSSLHLLVPPRLSDLMHPKIPVIPGCISTYLMLRGRVYAYVAGHTNVCL